MIALPFPILLGWAFGYLVNYMADVLPVTRRFTRPVCDACGTPFELSGYLLGRPCAHCGRPRTSRFWVVQFAMAAASAYIWLRAPAKLGFGFGLVILIYFGIVFVIDLEHRLILHPTSIVGALLGLGAGWLSHGLTTTLLGGFAGFAIMMLLYLLGVLFSRFRARRMQAAGIPPDEEEALGAGDVILAGVLGLILGWPLIWFGLLLGILLAGGFGILLILGMLLVRRYKTQALMIFMPYGPFLILSAFIIVFFPRWLALVVPK